MEDEIDLAQYIKIVIKHWKLALGITLAAVITAGIVSFATPPVYEATVLVQSYEETPNRMSELAQSGETAGFMLKEMSDDLAPAERSLSAVKNIFKIDTGGTFIKCTARNADAQRAALLANAWAHAFTKYATEVSLNSMLPASELQAQIESTYNAYQEAQDSYESFQRTSQVQQISNRIADARLLFQALKLQESRKDDQGSSASGDAAGLAYLLIKLNSYTSIPQGTQLSPGAAAQVSKSDIDSLVRELEDRSAIHGTTADQVFDEINALSVQLDRESQRSKELLNSRDVAWNAYLDSLKNAQEVNIKRRTMISPVRLLNEATPPQDPTPSNRLISIGIGLVLGLILGVIAAFMAEYFERKKPTAPPKSNETS